MKAVFSWAGVIGGSPLGDQMYGNVSGWDLEKVVRRLDDVLEWICPIVNLRKGPLHRIPEMDIKAAIRDVTVEHRQQWLHDHRDELQKLNVPIFCVTAACDVHETAYFNASGWMLLNMYDSNNDMQVRNLPRSPEISHAHDCRWAARRAIESPPIERRTVEGPHLTASTTNHLSTLKPRHSF